MNQHVTGTPCDGSFEHLPVFLLLHSPSNLKGIVLSPTTQPSHSKGRRRFLSVRMCIYLIFKKSSLNAYFYVCYQPHRLHFHVLFAANCSLISVCPGMLPPPSFAHKRTQKNGYGPTLLEACRTLLPIPLSPLAPV